MQGVLRIGGDEDDHRLDIEARQELQSICPGHFYIQKEKVCRGGFQKFPGLFCISRHTRNGKHPQCHKVFLKAISCRRLVVYNYTGRLHMARVSVVTKWFPFSAVDKV